jgi:glycolate oxidase subunit GlcD
LDTAFIDQLKSLVGSDGLRESAAQKLAYQSDAYTLAKSPPGVVALPRSTDEVVAIIKLCRDAGVPVVPRGAGTGLSGGAMAREDSVLLCLSRMNAILSIDLPNRQMRVQAGVINSNLTKAVTKDGFHYAPDPSSQGASTIGGNIANNAGGPHTLKYGVTVNHILAAQVVLPSGERIELSQTDAGYDLLGLIVGSEGTLGIVTEATVKIVPNPEAVRTLLVSCDSVDTATKLISEIIAAGIVPAALEMIDQLIVQTVESVYHLGLPTDAGAVLLVEVDGAAAGIDTQAARIEQLCLAGGALEVRTASDPAERAKLWIARKKSVGTLGRLAPSHATQDGVVPRTKLPEMLREIQAIAKKYDLRIANVFHAGDGNLHPCVLFDERDPKQVERVIAAGGDVLRACLAAGGALTGEHGIGVEKQEFLGLMFSEDEIETMLQIRSVFNPNDLLNPGKLFPVGGNCCPHLSHPDTATLHGMATRAAGI